MESTDVDRFNLKREGGRSTIAIALCLYAYEYERQYLLSTNLMLVPTLYRQQAVVVFQSNDYATKKLL